MIYLNKKVLVVGSGISGIAATNLLCRHGAHVILYDSNENLLEEDIKLNLNEGCNVQLMFGAFDDTITSELDLVVLSPGVPTDLPFIVELRDKGILIWGEIELAYQFSKGKIIAITGTNGKTTTTTLVGQIMKTHFSSVEVVGNIGIPYTEVVENIQDDTVTVAEVSSFQLETIHSFRPDVSAILNITPDHLNRHHTMENYVNAKAMIAKNQTMNETIVLNYEDEEVRKIGDLVHTNVLYFSSRRKLEYGIYLEDDYIIYRADEIENIICNVNELKIFGRHSYENVMAAVGIAIVMEVPMDYIKKAIIEFVAVEHRIEYVTCINGVSYYNDSKGTNPDASMKAIEAMKTPTILIAGGYDKGAEFEEWIDAFGSKIKHLVLLGQTREKIAQTANKKGYYEITFVDSLEEAVKVSAQKAIEGDSVLLSPACASWGMFTNYEERGCLFKSYVRALESKVEEDKTIND